jgi:hypothetical protein
MFHRRWHRIGSDKFTQEQFVIQAVPSLVRTTQDTTALFPMSTRSTTNTIGSRGPRDFLSAKPTSESTTDDSFHGLYYLREHIIRVIRQNAVKIQAQHHIEHDCQRKNRIFFLF